MVAPSERTGWHAGKILATLFVLGFCILAGCSEDQDSPTPAPPENSGFTMLDLAQEAADTWLRTVKPEQNDWSWGDGVLMFGMSNLAEKTGESRYWDYMAQWMNHHVQEGYYIAFSDNCPPGIAAARLFDKTGESQYREVMDRVWDYLQNVADRTSTGGLNHMGFISGNQLWVDSLFMFGIVLNEMARQEGNAAYHQEIVDQIRIFSDHLRDPDTGLYRHMYDDTTGTVKPEGALFWARGNAWVFATLVEVLSGLPEDHPSRPEILSTLEKMAESIAGFQDGSGLWHTLLNDTTTYLETSASALYAFGFHKGVRLGLLSSEYAAVVPSAMNGIQTMLFRDCQGGLIVSGTSHGTSPGEREYYANVTTGDQVPYGVGALLLAAVEVGDWSASSAFPLRNPCPDYPVSPVSYEDFRDRAVYRLGQSDLEGAREDFRVMTDMDPVRGEGPFGTGLVDIALTAFRVFDALTRYTIEEIGWEDFQEVIRTDSLPGLERIREQISVARDDPGFSLHIPALQLNRRGMYTPLIDLSFDPENAGAVLVVLDLLEAALGLIASLPG